MLTKVGDLIRELNDSGIRYCHWKSNRALGESLAGETDLDFLIHREDAERFRAILGRLGFKPAFPTEGESYPSAEHYHALDEESGVLAHVHAYFRVITGESLAKNYRIPVEEMLLQNATSIDSVRVPSKSAELVVFTLRMMLKHTLAAELLLLYRYWDHVRKEARWLLNGGSLEESVELLNCWLPVIDTELFSECVAALEAPAPLFRRIVLGRRLRSQIRPYARRSAFGAWLSGIRKFAAMLMRRATRARKGMVPRSGGAVIAFVGPEASGKSTLISETSRWLGKHLAVDRIHAGKPKSTLLSFLPNLFVPALRVLWPAHRSTALEAQYGLQGQSERSTQADYPLVFAVRSALLAYDRKALLARAHRRAANGTIVFCDRYPSSVSGALDSAQLSHLAVPANRFSIRRLLARMEARWYRQIPPADLVIYLSAPLEVTLSRNETRGKKEPEDYVRRRHSRSSNLVFGKSPVYEVSSDQPFERTVREIKRVIWQAL